jgi:hypothetical protein
MELSDKIRRAFASRPKPEEAVDVNNQIQMDSDVEEGMWFSGRNWQEITWKDWQAHSSAIYYFSKDAFAYYLPSVLLLSLRNPEESLNAADSILMSLDRSPSTEGWNDGFVDHFIGLRDEEYGVMKEWLLELCEYPTYQGYGTSQSGPGERLARAFETVVLLQQESRRL